MTDTPTEPNSRDYAAGTDAPDEESVEHTHLGTDADPLAAGSGDPTGTDAPDTGGLDALDTPIDGGRPDGAPGATAPGSTTLP